MLENEITVTNIKSVLHISKNNPPNTVGIYTTEGGCPTYELIYRLFGEVETNFDGKILKNKKGTIQYLPKGQGDKIYEAKTIETGECIDIFFDSDVPLSNTAFCTEMSFTDDMREAFEKIYKLWLKKDVGYYYKAMCVLYKILNEMTQDKQRDVLYEKIRSGVEYLNRHFCDESIDYEKAVSLCNMSYSYFRRLFVKFFGLPPAKYVFNKKIEYAKELLQSHRFSVSEVADMVGFKDIYYFSAAFKKSTGRSPSEFKLTSYYGLK